MDETASEHQQRAALIVIGCAAITTALLVASRLLGDDTAGITALFAVGLVLAEVMGTRSQDGDLDHRLAPTPLPFALALPILGLPGLLVARIVATVAAQLVGGALDRRRSARPIAAVIECGSPWASAANAPITST